MKTNYEMKSVQYFYTIKRTVTINGKKKKVYLEDISNDFTSTSVWTPNKHRALVVAPIFAAWYINQIAGTEINSKISLYL